MRRACRAVLVVAGLWVAASCAGKKEGGGDDVSTDVCVPYCERSQAGGCNQLGNIDSCKLACGLLLTEGTPCGAATKVFIDCRMQQADVCRGCDAQESRANSACMM